MTQEGPTIGPEPSFEHQAELPPSSSHPTIDIVSSEDVPAESEAQ